MHSHDPRETQGAHERVRFVVGHAPPRADLSVEREQRGEILLARIAGRQQPLPHEVQVVVPVLCAMAEESGRADGINDLCGCMGVWVYGCGSSKPLGYRLAE